MAIKSSSFLVIVMLVVLIIPGGCSRQGDISEPSDSSTDLNQWIKDLDAAWASHDMEKILPLFTEDCVYEDVASSKVFHGKQELRAMIKEYFEAFPDLRTETKCFALGSKICMEWIMTGTHRGKFWDYAPTGKSFSIHGVSVSELEGGLKRIATIMIVLLLRGNLVSWLTPWFLINL